MWKPNSFENLALLLTKVKDVVITINAAAAHDLAKKAEAIVLQHKHAATLTMPIADKTEEARKAVLALAEARQKVFSK